jgi:tRNA nucleotidyltransferase (CCA-adding enzyme)
MPSLEEIREEVLTQLRPTSEEITKAKSIYEKIRISLQEIIIDTKLQVAFIQLEGSAGRKQTQLRNLHELDIFIGLPPSIFPQMPSHPNEQRAFLRKQFRKLVQQVLFKAAKKAGCGDSQIAYAEHPYLTTQLEKFKIDLVFCFDLTREYILKNGPITAVDRTPHHSDFVNSHLNSKQRDDVRILKGFFHNSFVYGDASPVGQSGFTGFSTEMLVFYLNDITSIFQKFDMLSKTPLDYFNRSLQELKRKFKHDYLLITDPTDPQRNIASSITKRAYRYAMSRVRELLKTPSKEFFLPRQIPLPTKENSRKIQKNTFVIEFEDKTGWHYTKTRDKLYRYFNKLVQFLQNEPTGETRFGYSIFEEVFEEPIFAIALFVTNNKISPTFIRKGPPQHLKSAVKQFLAKHPTAVLQNGKFNVEIPRKYFQAEDAIVDFLKSKQISKNLELLDITPLGKTKTGKRAFWILQNSILPFSSDG